MILEDDFQNDQQEEAFPTNLEENQEFANKQNTIEDNSEEQQHAN